MQQRWFPRLAVIRFTTALLLSQVTVTEAQVTEARKLMENAKQLYTRSVDAISAGKFSDAVTPLNDLKANVNIIVEQQLWRRAENTLHEKDRNVLLPKVRELDDKAKELRIMTGLMQSPDEAARSSNLSRLKDGWRDFDNAFKQLSDYVNTYSREMKELQERVKKFQEFCGRDCG